MDVIGDLLQSSLLSDLGDDEARVAKVRAAAEGMAETFLGASRPLVPAAVLAGLDEHTAADSTVLEAATKQVFAEWETFRAAFAGTPIEVLRAVALGAVEAAAGHEPAVLQAAWYTARTAAEEIPAGRWSGPVGRIVDAWRYSASEAIADIWVPRLDAVTLRMPSLQPSDDTEIAIESPLREQVAVLEQNNWQTFSQQLAPRFAQYVNGLLEASEVGSAEAQRRAVAQVKDFTKELGGRLRGAIGAQAQALTAMHLRTDLLWWCQSRYSDRLGVGYAELGSAADVAVATAHDLHLRVPRIAPVAVEHVLADLVCDTVPKTSPLKLTDLEAAAEASVLRSSKSTPPSPPSLLDAITTNVATPVLADSAELPPARAAVILFRDLQARRLASAPLSPSSPEPTE